MEAKIRTVSRTPFPSYSPVGSNGDARQIQSLRGFHCQIFAAEARCLILIMFGVSSTAIILLAIVETQKTDAQGGEITFWGDANFSGEQRRIRGSLIGQYCYNEDVGEPSSITWKNQSTTGLFGGRAKLAFYTEHDCKGTVRAWFSTEKDFPTNLALDGIDNQIKSFMLWQTSKNPKVLTPY